MVRNKLAATCDWTLAMRFCVEGIPDRRLYQGGGPHALGAQTASIRCDNKLASRETFQGSRADAVAA